MDRSSGFFVLDVHSTQPLTVLASADPASAGMLGRYTHAKVPDGSLSPNVAAAPNCSNSGGNNETRPRARKTKRAAGLDFHAETFQLATAPGVPAKTRLKVGALLEICLFLPTSIG